MRANTQELCQQQQLLPKSKGCKSLAMAGVRDRGDQGRSFIAKCGNIPPPNWAEQLLKPPQTCKHYYSLWELEVLNTTLPNPVFARTKRPGDSNSLFPRLALAHLACGHGEGLSCLHSRILTYKQGTNMFTYCSVCAGDYSVNIYKALRCKALNKLHYYY